MENCGCTWPEPHSHLVYGHNCECGKGVPKNIPTAYTEPIREIEKLEDCIIGSDIQRITQEREKIDEIIMKPSERIKEIAKGLEYEGNPTLTLIPAILEYLDEQHELNNPKLPISGSLKEGEIKRFD